jgi:FkbM family methyltransferase
MEPAKVEVTLNNKKFYMELNLEHISQNLIYHELMVHKKPYEQEVTTVVCDILEPGDTFVDVGAHVGWFTLIGARMVEPLGRVLAIEAETENYLHLLKHIKLNITNGSVRAYSRVATSYCGPVQFHLNLDNDGGHALWPPSNHSFNEKTKETPQVVELQGITLDELCRKEGVSEIKLVKIDTEGAEVEVLRGAKQLLSEHRIEHVIAEVNAFGLKQMGTNVDEMIELLTDFDYSYENIGTPGEEFVYNILFTR